MAKKNRSTSVFAESGHFYSPIQDPKEVETYLASALYQRQRTRVDALLDYPGMAQIWRQIRVGVVAFPLMPELGFRYYIANNQFQMIDSAVASAMLTHLNPTRIVEIGCGFSTAAMFDTIDRMAAPRLQNFTCIDPDMSRLDALSLSGKIERRAERVQDVDLAVFAELKAGDILFIDSSHVLKAASDVHYEYLHILPSLPSGVIVHIHDVFYPFEYPRQWLLREVRAWNEAYLVDMMLTYGNGYEVLFFNHAMIENYPSVLDEELRLLEREKELRPRAHQRTNGSIWLKKR